MIESPETTDVASSAGPGGAPAPAGLDEENGVVRAAAVLAAGNVASRVLGMAREMVKANLFGASGLLSAFEIAAYVPTTLFDLIIGGMVNSSLVPVFSEYAAKERRAELWAAVSTFLSVATVALLLVVLVVELFAPQVAWLLGAYNLEDTSLTTVAIRLTRLAAPAVLFLSLSSILTGALYALKRFALPAFTAAIFNGTIVVVALLRPEHIDSLVYGLLLGSILQVVLQLPALRDARLRWNLNWRHPVIYRILRLYAPIVAGLVVNQAGIFVGINLATRATHATLTPLGVPFAAQTGDASLTYMRYATTLYQFPLGLVVTALSIAILPTLSQQALGALSRFKQTLAEGIRLVLALILPAAVGLFALAFPIVSLLFEHGQFTNLDTHITGWVLRVFLFGLPFAAVDQMLIFASYARKDTLRPAIVGVASILVYVGVAVALLRPLGLLSLMVADAIKHVTHTLLMTRVLQSQIGGLRGEGISRSAAKSLLAALTTGVAAYAVADLAGPYAPGGLLGQLAVVLAAGLGGLAAFVTMVRLLKISEARSLRQILRRQ
ncbi:MAG: murein biosynthesis integral membrane protein MurJ [Chloroflexota bacterium]